ncbi:predicted protein [Histoplasma capsulatum var. duboisii H88]|uniref:Predicted protein n=1 Tax=Ajellomyces capsulatus (strain H88) TaxID=544711 RepID=F0ULQ1_AJEC8|nr:predicted protein [Histoplasma capsulatum var. duboisii H88]
MAKSLSGATTGEAAAKLAMTRTRETRVIFILIINSVTLHYYTDLSQETLWDKDDKQDRNSLMFLSLKKLDGDETKRLVEQVKTTPGALQITKLSKAASHPKLGIADGICSSCDARTNSNNIAPTKITPWLLQFLSQPYSLYHDGTCELSADSGNTFSTPELKFCQNLKHLLPDSNQLSFMAKNPFLGLVKALDQLYRSAVDLPLAF